MSRPEAKGQASARRQPPVAGPAARIAALCALDSWQELLELVCHGVGCGWEKSTGENEQNSECYRKSGQNDGAGNHYRRANPLNPKNAMDMMPAVMRAIAGPLNGDGTSASSSRSRKPLSSVNTIPNPSAAPAP